MNENLLDGPGSLLRPGATAVPPQAELDARADYTLEPLEAAKDMIVREKTPLAGENEVLVAFKDGSIKPLAANAGTRITATSAAAVTPPPVTPPVKADSPVYETPPPVLNPNPRHPARPPPPPPVLGTPTPDHRGPIDDLSGARKALEEGRVAEARAAFTAVTQRDPQSAEGFRGLGDCASLAGDLGAAMLAYLNVARLAPDTPNLQVALAEVYLARGNLRSAQQWLDSEVKLRPNSAWAWSWLGTLQMEAGERAKAAASMARAAALDREVTAWRFKHGAALLSQNQPKRAAAEFAAALMLDPRGIGAHYQLAECHARLGERDKAMESFNRFLEGDATSEWATRARSRIEELRRGR
ncbi:MAG: tetratricopeptide repeat protein [Opitutaceae bacterium]|nr:tetratricopeptide repeat protein [Opitutaceae bacterium]